MGFQVQVNGEDAFEIDCDPRLVRLVKIGQAEAPVQFNQESVNLEVLFHDATNFEVQEALKASAAAEVEQAVEKAKPEKKVEEEEEEKPVAKKANGKKAAAKKDK